MKILNTGGVNKKSNIWDFNNKFNSTVYTDTEA